MRLKCVNLNGGIGGAACTFGVKSDTGVRRDTHQNIRPVKDQRRPAQKNGWMNQ